MPIINNSQGFTALLVGLEDPVASALKLVLAEHKGSVLSIPFESVSHCVAVCRHARPDVVFCSADNGLCRGLVMCLRGHAVEVPVVAVSRLPEVSDWLDAIEAGASDYCGSPFEPRQIRWVLDGIFRYRRSAAA